MSKEIIPIQQIAQIIRIIRGEKVLLGFDLAPLYGVTIGNKAMRRNRERFPSDFMFQLAAAEAEPLIFQFGISKGRGGRRHRPYAFTEQGVAMLSCLWAGERTRLACWRWRPRHRELFQPRFLHRSEVELKESFSARRRKEHARRVCSPDSRG
jgi:ORF6N domain